MYSAFSFAYCSGFSGPQVNWGFGILFVIFSAADSATFSPLLAVFSATDLVCFFPMLKRFFATFAIDLRLKNATKSIKPPVIASHIVFFFLEEVFLFDNSTVSLGAETSFGVTICCF